DRTAQPLGAGLEGPRTKGERADGRTGAADAQARRWKGDRGAEDVRGCSVMAKQVTKSATPRLRFPEFRKHRAWEPTRLDSVLKFQAGFPFPSKGFSEEVRGLRLVRNRDLRS